MQQTAENNFTVKVDKEDPRAKLHYIKTVFRDGKEIKIWECGLCGKEFRFQYTLMRHIPTHTDVRDFHCDKCPKSFRQLSTLAQHRATHLNKRPFFCDVCNKSFNRVSTLISHRKIHSNDKRHTCHICNKGFHQKGNLRNHIYTHTNARPYKCELCGKGFNQKSNLVCHKSSAHEKKQFLQCGICSTRFIKQQSFNSHMEICHKIPKLEQRLIKQEPEDNPNGNEASDSLSLTYELSIINKEEVNELNNVKHQASKHGNPISKSLISGHAVLAEIKHKPTGAMLRLNELGQIPFILLYQPGEQHPKICKALIENDKYYLVNPKNSDIEMYFTPNNKNLLYHKFPIVSTVIQKYDNQNKLQALVMPAGLPPQLVESSLGTSGRKSIVDKDRKKANDMATFNAGLEHSTLVQLNKVKENFVNGDTNTDSCGNISIPNISYQVGENTVQYLAFPNQENLPRKPAKNDQKKFQNNDKECFEFVTTNKNENDYNGQEIQIRIFDENRCQSFDSLDSFMERLNTQNQEILRPDEEHILPIIGIPEEVNDCNGSFEIVTVDSISHNLEKQQSNFGSYEDSKLHESYYDEMNKLDINNDPMTGSNYMESENFLMENYKFNSEREKTQLLNTAEPFDSKKNSQYLEEPLDIPMEYCLSESFLDDITSNEIDGDMMQFTGFCDIDFQLDETVSQDFKDDLFGNPKILHGD